MIKIKNNNKMNKIQMNNKMNKIKTNNKIINIKIIINPPICTKTKK